MIYFASSKVLSAEEHRWFYIQFLWEHSLQSLLKQQTALGGVIPSSKPKKNSILKLLVWVSKAIWLNSIISDSRIWVIFLLIFKEFELRQLWSVSSDFLPKLCAVIPGKVTLVWWAILSSRNVIRRCCSSLTAILPGGHRSIVMHGDRFT